MVKHLFIGSEVKIRSHIQNEQRVPELVPVLGSQPADDRNHKLGDRVPLLSAKMPAVTSLAAEHHRPNYTA